MFDPIDISKIVSSDAAKEVVEVYKYLKKYRENTDREWWFEWVEGQREIGKTSIATINCKIKQMSSFYHFLVNENIVNEKLDL